MKEYYITNADKKQIGPIAFERLLDYGLTENSYVWTDGMADWELASKVPELRRLLRGERVEHNNISRGTNMMQPGHHRVYNDGRPRDNGYSRSDYRDRRDDYNRDDEGTTRIGAGGRTKGMVWISLLACLLPWGTLLGTFQLTGDTITFAYLSPFASTPMWTFLTPVLYLTSLFMGVMAVTQSAMTDTLLYIGDERRAKAPRTFSKFFIFLSIIASIGVAVMMVFPIIEEYMPF